MFFHIAKLALKHVKKGGKIAKKILKKRFLKVNMQKVLANALNSFNIVLFIQTGLLIV